MNTIHLYPAPYQLEVGCLKYGRPSYCWTTGYIQACPDGVESTALTRDNWRGMAKRDGAKLVFHKTEKEARHAIVAAGVLS